MRKNSGKTFFQLKNDIPRLKLFHSLHTWVSILNSFEEKSLSFVKFRTNIFSSEVGVAGKYIRSVILRYMPTIVLQGIDVTDPLDIIGKIGKNYFFRNDDTFVFFLGKDNFKCDKTPWIICNGS